MAAPFRLPVAPPVFADDVVHLRVSGASDCALMVEASRDPDVQRWTFLPPNLDDDAARALMQRWQSLVHDGRARQYVVAAAGAPSQPLGMATLVLQDSEDAHTVDVAYWLLPEARGRGLMTRAVSLLVQWALDVARCRRAALHTKVGNTASEAVARRCGFRDVGSRTWTHQGERIHLRRWERLP